MNGAKKIVQRASMAAVVSAALAVPTAYAATYTFDGEGVDATITTSNAVDALGGYDITGISGTVAGFGSITGLILNPVQPNANTIGVGGGTNFTYDNVFFTSDPHLDNNGVAFQTSSGQDVNLWGNSAGNYEAFVGNYVSDTAGSAVVTTVTAVPEPKTYAMWLAGLALLTFIRRAKPRSFRCDQR